ncbi:hypothetical protein WM16_18255 [Burkholderia ubonensis]|uniref:Uncharacterized protein n=1 Tax=Burkholderia ubonensis TaxID=101571 RepID=A0A108CED5_9BURK|nr:hypothetical protein WM16_18255 [Burkholderia ubonensis]
MTLIHGMYGQPLLGRSGVLRRIIASTVFGLRGLRLFGRDLLLASAMVNSSGRMSWLWSAGRMGCRPYGPRFFAAVNPLLFSSLRYVLLGKTVSDHRCKGDSVQQPMIEKQGFETSLAALAS